jgi:enamine deaminase RidA (YjgF/YER057c/UK114 family)
MSTRTNIPARTPWADVLGYSRAVVFDGRIHIAGTLPVDENGALVGGSDAAQQARQVLKIIVAALTEAGSTPQDVVRTRIYLRDFADLYAIAAVHQEVFGTVRPACTVAQVGLADPDHLVQMDADAVGRAWSTQ